MVADRKCHDGKTDQEVTEPSPFFDETETDTSPAINPRDAQDKAKRELEERQRLKKEKQEEAAKQNDTPQ